jgi:hypothetical protein
VFVIFYGLDWVATVPPTVMLCREWFGPEAGSIVFGWVFASHQIGASAMAFGAGVIRDHTDSYDPAFYTGAVLCVVAAGLSISIRRRQAGPPSTGTGVRRFTSHTPSTTSAAPTMSEA